jgi:hypothetical protein
LVSTLIRPRYLLRSRGRTVQADAAASCADVSKIPASRARRASVTATLPDVGSRKLL